MKPKTRPKATKQLGSLERMATESVSGRPRRGPPNRMNDLSYTEWMKFQKSFFRHVSLEETIEKNIAFFTKSTWADGSKSRNLILGGRGLGTDPGYGGRIIESVQSINSIKDLLSIIDALAQKGNRYDFIVVNALELVRSSVIDGSGRRIARISSTFPPQRSCTSSTRGCGDPDPVGVGNFTSAFWGVSHWP